MLDIWESDDNFPSVEHPKADIKHLTKLDNGFDVDTWILENGEYVNFLNGWIGSRLTCFKARTGYQNLEEAIADAPNLIN